MKKIVKIAVVFFSLSAITLAAAKISETKKIRYRITVEIDTPEGIKTGSSVWEIKFTPVKISNVTGYKDSVKGEAVFIDLGARGELFALKRGRNGRPWLHQVFYWTFPSPPNVSGNESLIDFYSDLPVGNKASLPAKDYPLFVYLRDKKNPQTVETVFEIHNGNHGEIGSVKTNRLEDLFGDGVRISDVKIEVTSDPVEFHLHEKLNWLSRPEGDRLREKPNISTGQPLKYLDFQEGRVSNE